MDSIRLVLATAAAQRHSLLVYDRPFVDAFKRLRDLCASNFPQVRHDALVAHDGVLTSRTGMRNARVLPEPVLAAPTTSSPASKGGMASCCTHHTKAAIRARALFYTTGRQHAPLTEWHASNDLQANVSKCGNKARIISCDLSYVGKTRSRISIVVVTNDRCLFTSSSHT